MRLATERPEGINLEDFERVLEQAEAVLADPRSAVGNGLESASRGTLAALAAQLYAMREAGDRATNLARAAALGEEAAAGFVAAGPDMAVSLGLAHSERAAALMALAELGRSTFFLEAADAYAEAARSMSKETQPFAWPVLQLRRGAACMRHAEALGSLDFGCTESVAQAVLDFVTPETAPEVWAEAQMLLANSAFARAQDGDVDGVEVALGALRSVIDAPLRVPFPLIWARANQRLAQLLLSLQRLSLDQAEEALAAIEAAEAVFKQIGAADRLTSLAPLRRIAEDEVLAASATESAGELQITIITGEEFRFTPVFLTPQGTPEPDIDLLHAARREFDPDTNPTAYAERLLDLAEAYLSSDAGARETNRLRAEEASIFAFELAENEGDAILRARAAGVYGVTVALDPNRLPYSERMAETRQVFEFHIAEARTLTGAVRAVLHINLANVYLQQLPAEEAALTLAREALDAASQFLLEDAPPHLEAAVRRTRAELTHRNAWLLGGLDASVRSEGYAEAAVLYSDLLAKAPVLQQRDRLAIETHLLWMAINTDDWDAAAAREATVMAAVEGRLAEVSGENAIKAAAEQASRPLALVALSAVERGAPAEAMMALERTRALTARTVLEGRRTGQIAARSQEIARLRTDMAFDLSNLHPIFAERRAKARSAIYRSQATAPIAPQPTVPSPGTAFLTMAVTAEGGAVILQTPEGYFTERLPRRSFPVLAYQFYTSIGQSDDAAWDIGEGIGSGEAADNLAQPVWALIERAGLPDGTRIFWVSPPDLAHIALDAGRHPNSAAALIDRYQVTVLPAFSLLPELAATPATPVDLRSVAGLFDSLGNLPHAALERAILRVAAPGGGLAEVPPGLSANEALEGFEGHDVWQFAAHNSFAAEDFLASGIVLGRDGSGREERLTLEHLLYSADVAAPELVLLTVCQSAVVDVKHFPEDVTGIATAFLRLGTRGVISARWDVSDRATALLVGRFHWAMLRDGATAPEALRTAKLWLRDATARDIRLFLQAVQAEASADTLSAFAPTMGFLANRVLPESRPYADPKYWAAFSYYGL
ncbi:MAG: CHAT domain-containing protein [Pseudomonadota bacterium]